MTMHPVVSVALIGLPYRIITSYLPSIYLCNALAVSSVEIVVKVISVLMMELLI